MLVRPPSLETPSGNFFEYYYLCLSRHELRALNLDLKVCGFFVCSPIAIEIFPSLVERPIL